jgi:O-antigen/teichoic acid export membrane protein
MKNLFIYFGFDGINKALPFIIIPIIAKYITTAEFGLITNFLILVQVLYALCTLNNFSALSVNYYKQQNNMSGYFSNLVYFSLLLSACCLILILFFSHIINKYLRLSLFFQLLALIAALTTAIPALYTTLLRMKKNAIKFGIIQISQNILFFILIILFVMVILWGWKGRIYAQIISSIAICLIVILMLPKESITWSKVDFQQQKKLFKWGIPLLPHTLSFWLKSGTDKIIITNLMSLSANGIYSVTLTFGGIISLFTTSFFNMYSPKIYEKLTIHERTEDINTKNTIEKYLVRNIYYFAIALGIICFCAYILLKFIITFLFTGDYLLSIPLLHLVLVGSFLNGIYSMFSGFLFFKNKTTVLGSITFFSALFQIVLTYFSVKFWGLEGALYANIVSWLIMLLFLLRYTTKLYKLPWTNHIIVKK